jgi:hypothetical protein
MKRSVAFLAAVCLSTGVLFATVASAQYSSPKPQPPTQTPPPPSDAADDTLKSKGETSPVAPVNEPKAAPAPAASDTMSAAAKRRAHFGTENPRQFVFSLGLGSGINYQPEEFKNDYSPSFGGMMAFGVRQYGFQAGVHFGYNFYSRHGLVPNDLNIFTIMAELQFAPTKSRARPYLVVCGGYFRQWIVDLDYTENVLGYGGGAGVEMALDKTRRLFLDVRYIEGQTRQTQDQSNTVIIPIRLGVNWAFR